MSNWYFLEQKFEYKKNYSRWFRQNRWWLRLLSFLAVSLVLNNLFNHQTTFESWVPSLILLFLYFFAWFVFNRYRHVKGLFINFIFPIVLAILILTLGTIGFNEARPKQRFGDNFFAAANLITLNSSDFKDFPVVSQWLRTARYLGGFLAGYAFLLAFALAVGKENLSRLSFWAKRRFYSSFYVIIGDNIKALDLAFDLSDHQKRFVFLDNSTNDEILNALEEVDCWYFRGKAFSQNELKKLYFHKAKAVFVFCQNDEINFRVLQEMDELAVENPNANQKWFVHFNDFSLRESVHKFLQRRSAQLNTFCVESLTAMRLLKKYPIFRPVADTEKNIHIVIVGMNKQAIELLFEICHIAHFKKTQITRILVFYRGEDIQVKEQFLKRYPVFDQQNNFGGVFNYNEKKIVNYTFGNIEINFETLPESEIKIRNHEFKLNAFLGIDSVNSLYVCLDDGLENAKFLELVLPTLSYLKHKAQRDIEVFSYYNYPDKDEQEYIESKLNTMAPHIQVYCFGNMLDECSLISIENSEGIDLAKRIALIYHVLYNDIEVADLEQKRVILEIKKNLSDIALQANNEKPFEEILKNNIAMFLGTLSGIKEYESLKESVWSSINEIDRMSNIRAANHAKIKFLMYEPILGNKWHDADLKELSEIEHRRWNAEKLLLGWRPYINHEEWKSYKTMLRNQKYHNHLVSFESLSSYEKSKDWVQVMGIITNQ